MNNKAKWVSKAGIGIEDVFKRSPAINSNIAIEKFKGKRTKFWPGAALGFCIGYCFYLGHMYQIFH